MSAASDLNMSGVIASRPAFGIAGRFYLASDTNQLSYDTGAAWIAAGSVGPAGELGHTEVTTSSLTTASTTPVDLSGVTLTVTIGARPVLITAYLPQWSHTVNDALAVVELYDTTASALIQEAVLGANGSGNGSAICIPRRAAPSAGSQSYKLRFYTITAGTLTVNGAATHPITLTVVEL